MLFEKIEQAERCHLNVDNLLASQDQKIHSLFVGDALGNEEILEMWENLAVLTQEV